MDGEAYSNEVSQTLDALAQANQRIARLSDRNRFLQAELFYLDLLYEGVKSLLADQIEVKTDKSFDTTEILEVTVMLNKEEIMQANYPKQLRAAIFDQVLHMLEQKFKVLIEGIPVIPRKES